MYLIKWTIEDISITLVHNPIMDGPIEMYQNSDFYEVEEV